MKSSTAPDIHSPTDRLTALRDRASATRPRQVRVEVLLGALLVVGGVGFAVLSGRDEPRVAPVPPVVASSETSSSDGAPSDNPSTVGTRLLADEAILAVALEAGQFPPDLTVGDEVLVTVTSEFDVDAPARTLESTPVVLGVEVPGESSLRWVVTLRAERSVPEVVAGARSVHLAIVERAR